MATTTSTHFDILPDIITPGTYGDSTHVAQVTLTAKGLVSNAVNVPIAGALIYDLDDAIKLRISVLFGAANLPQFSYWSDTFMATPTKAGSAWTSQSGGIVEYHSSPGGIVRVGGAGYRNILVDSQNGSAYPLVADPGSWVGHVDDSLPFYMFWRFRLLTSEGWNETDCSLIMGLVDGNTLAVCGVGIGYGSSPAKFGGVGGNVLNAASTVNVATTTAQDFAWHDMELARLADGRYFAIIDGGTPVNISSAIQADFHYGMPFAQIMTTLSTSGTLPVVLIDHAAFAAPENKAAVNTSPTPIT